MRRVLMSIVALIGLCALGSGLAQAQVPCESRSDECFTFVIFGAVHDPNNPLLASPAQGQKQRYEDDIARRVHQQAKAGQARFYPRPLPVMVYVWKSSRRGLERIQIYDNPQGGDRRAHAAVPVRGNPPNVPSLGPPDYAFQMTTVGKPMMIAFPDEFFTPGTHILICAPTVPTIRPDSRVEQGIWLTDGTLPWYRRPGKRLADTFFLVAGS